MSQSAPQPAAARRKSSAAGSLGIMLAASIASACTGVILMFAIPRLISVDDFGYWRTFLLYAGYAGFLHLGLVDGALLHWSQPASPRSASAQAGPALTHTLTHTLSALTLQHLAFGAVALALLATPLAHRLYFREILLALVAYALLFNLCGLVQVHMQSRQRFSAVAMGMAGPGIVFVLALFLPALAALRRHALTGSQIHPVTLTSLLWAYLLAWTIILALLLAAARSSGPTASPAHNLSREDNRPRPDLRSPIPAYIRAGWPIMLANTSYGLMQSADRVTVNLTRPIHDFAIYSLSQSTIYVPVTIIAAVARVAFSHFATVAPPHRAAAAQATVRGLTLLWVLLLPYYYLVEWIVVRYLPRYTPGLAAGRVLLLSVLFLSLISIVQANTSSLAGQQRRFFLSSLAALALAFLTAALASRGIPGLFTGSLTAVAISQVVSAALWWLGNQYWTQRHSPLPPREIARVLAAFTTAAAALYLAALAAPLTLKILAYYILLAAFLRLLYYEELKQLWQRIAALRSTFHPRTAHR